MRPLISLCLLPFFAVGCASLLGQDAPPADTFLLIAPRAVDASIADPSDQGQIRVKVSSVGPGLASDKVASIEAIQQRPLSGVRWIEPLPVLVEKTTVQYLAQQLPGFYVSRERSARADFELRLEVRNMAVLVVAGQPDQVHVQVDWQLLAASGQILDEGRTLHSRAVARNARSSVMEAFAEANLAWLRSLSEQLARGLAEAGK